MGLPAQADSGVVQPNGVSLVPHQEQQFTVTGYSQNVTWSVQPLGMGTITSTGFYTAPASTGVAYICAQPPAPVAPYVSTIYVSDGQLIPTAPVPSGGVCPTSPTSSGGGTSPTTGTMSITPASSYLQPGQSAMFTALVQGIPSQLVQWSLSPSLGTIANGLYTAPSSFGNDSQVTISATNLQNSTQTATATVLLGQPVSTNPGGSTISISVTPGLMTLAAGQSAQFIASVLGASTPAVTWSLTPNVGSVYNGLYTAPATISSQETVVLTAISAADPSKSAAVSLILTPVATVPPNVTISLSPGSASLTGGQSATFTTTVTGTTNSAVTWSLSPQVGTVTNGVYVAPAIIASQQNVTVTATSVADPTATATATVSLQPVAVTVGPASASLSAGQSATFTALVSGTGNTAVTWSLSPAVGSMVNGLYISPATISSLQMVTVIATSVVDTTKTGTATVTLTPGTAPPPTVTLPLEVIGPNGTTVSAWVTLPSGANLTGQLVLGMAIHGVRFDTQASVQVNNSGWLPISTGNVTLLGNAAAYGGIGGGFATLRMNMNLPAGAVQAGGNTITFRFNQTDGRVSGFRVLGFNILAADGTPLIPQSTFVYEDPNTWQPPSTAASDIAAGETLWRTAPLTIPVIATGGTQPIQAHCTDCHAQDGRDLKYFNYSNNSIQTRALFHGLTAEQGNQIASYIRTLNVVNPGRPWRPPYQPGPGLDSQPAIEWSAGAGLESIMESDQDMVNAIFPSGIQPSVFAATSRLDQREVPLTVQLPDWNQWLPGTHPIDAFGAAFTTSGYNTIYQTLSSSLQVNNPSVYVGQELNFQNWFGAFYDFYVQMGTPIWNNSPASWTPANVDAMYSLSQWGLVKNWELNNQFQLEGLAQSIFGPQADPRAWYSNFPFFVSPHELKMPSNGVVGLRNGTADTYNYLSYIWYNLQLILNDSNGQQQEQFPIDWGYAEGFVKAMGSMVAPQAGIETLWMIKGLQIMQQSGAGPQLGLAGWQPTISQPSLLVTEEWNDGVWSGVDPTTRVALATGIVQSWLQQASQYTPQQYYAGGWTTPTAVPVPFGNAYDGVFPDWVWFMIPRFTFIGMDPSIAAQLAAWAQTIWPNADWTAVQNATCSWQNNQVNGYIICSQ
jgi:hypothetical protein